jgi:DNA-binding transcriptional ArsR family regulator
MSGDEKKKQEDRIEFELRGKTMEVYMYLLRHKEPLGTREVQRALGFSSPSIVVHHIDKLLRLGIVEKDDYGRYVLAKKVDAGVLNAFVQLGRFPLPRLGFYAAFFTTIAFAYLIVNLARLDLYAVFGTVGGALAFWYEALRIWKRKPF